MAQDCTESSAATSSTAPNWWADVHTNSLSSWTTNSNTNQWNPHSNSSGEEDVSMSTSFTNASNHSGLSIDSSRRLTETGSTNELMGEAASDNQLWNHVLLNVGSTEELHNHQDVGGNLLNGFSSKTLSSGMFEPACDYLKKMDNGWEFSSSPSFNNFEKNFNGLINENMFQNERLSKLSNLVSNWSIAPPDPEINHQFDPPRPCNISLSSPMSQYPPSDANYHHMKPTVNNAKHGSYSCYGHDLEGDNHEQREVETHGDLLRRSSFNSNNGIGYQIGINNNSVVGDNGKYYYGVPDLTCNNNGRNFADILTFSSSLSKPLVDVIASSKPNLKTLNLSDCKAHAIQTSYPPTISTCNTLGRSNKRAQGTGNEGKKKRSEESCETILKKPKHESSTLSSAKVQVPKAKLTDKITTLQQIVSPFGKTDTASVLGEAIVWIKHLQEQVQEYLSNPYMRTNASKDPWGGLDRKDRGGDVKHDLKSRGLCLVPISRTPQVYRENTGPDYWSTPAYRGRLYR